MSEELTLLEALEDLRNYLDFVKTEKFSKTNLVRYFNEKFDIIETALKDYEMEHTLRVRLENINYELVREKQANEKKLKALEIIKEKKIVPVYIMNAENVEEYNRQLKQITFKKDYEVRKLTKEEFDLLKEVLK